MLKDLPLIWSLTSPERKEAKGKGLEACCSDSKVRACVILLDLKSILKSNRLVMCKRKKKKKARNFILDKMHNDSLF